MPTEFVNNSLWNSGPKWLAVDENNWPQAIEPSLKELPGLKEGIFLFRTPSCSDIYLRFRNFKRFVRVIAYTLRWRNLKSEEKLSQLYPEISSVENRICQIVKLIPPLKCSGIIDSECKILSTIQREKFFIELRRLSKTSDEITGPSRKSTCFDGLYPFIDDEGPIRVDGRLKKSDPPFDQRHPIILPIKHLVTDMIIRQINLSD